MLNVIGVFVLFAWFVLALECDNRFPAGAAVLWGRGNNGGPNGPFLQPWGVHVRSVLRRSRRQRIKPESAAITITRHRIAELQAEY